MSVWWDEWGAAWREVAWEFRRRMFNAGLRGGKYVRWS